MIAIAILLQTLVLSNATFGAESLSLRDRLHGRRVVAHEGAGVFELEGNTMPSFERALKAGADVIKVDLQLSKDGVPVIYHDDSFGFLSCCSGKLNEMTAEEIKKCSFTFLSPPIPTFEEVLQWANGRIVIDAEWKDSSTVIPSIALVQKYDAHNWTYFQAKSDIGRYQQARSMDARINIQFALRDSSTLDWVIAQNDDNLLVVEIDGDLITREVIDRIHGARKLVTIDVWKEDSLKEFLGANCWWAFDRGIDLPASNRVESCVDQRDHWRALIPALPSTF